MSLSYTTGNPNNLTGGANASMNDIQGPFVDIRTFLTDGSGTINDTLLTSPTSSVWRTVAQVDYRSGINGLSTTPAYQGGTALILSGSTGQCISGLWIPDTTDIAVNAKTTRLRLRLVLVPNTIGPGVTFTWGLYPISAVGGAVASAVGVTLGTVIAGTTAVISPSASTPVEVKSSSFDISAVTGGIGGYVIGVVASSAQAANSEIAAEAWLEMRHT